MEYILKKRMGVKEYYAWKRNVREYYEWWYINDLSNSQRNDDWLNQLYNNKARGMYNNGFFADAFYVSQKDIYNFGIGKEFEVGLLTVGRYSRDGTTMHSLSLFSLTANGVVSYDGVPLNAGLAASVFKIHAERQLPLNERNDILIEGDVYIFGAGTYKGIYKVGDIGMLGYSLGWNTVPRGLNRTKEE